MSKKIKEFRPETEESESFSIKDILNGKVLKNKFLKKNWAYLLFLVFLAFLYINNHFSVEALLKEHLALTRELKELKYESITISSELMKKSKQSEVVRKVQEAGIGLDVLTTPPGTVTVKK